jgi:dihydrodiol dehydrogenase / D-xylose 1-dehydrogenase (NADP)
VKDTVRWGILAPGNIAHKFAKGLEGCENAVLHGVGSRSAERAAEFAEKYGATRSYGSYEELVDDPEIDAIYIANPHPYHKDSTILCLEHGKPVLCEKPFTVNAADAEEAISVATKRKVFLMEAMWTRFLPAMQQARAWIDAGRIGDVRMINASFSFRTGWNPEGRALNPDLAGGGLLDVGIYVLSLAYWITQKDPTSISSAAHIGDTGVDEQAGMLLKYDDGAIALLSCGVRTSTSHNAAIYGTEGWIEFPESFWNGTKAVLHAGDEEIEFEQPHLSNGYEYQAIEVGNCLAEGKTESTIMSLDETLRIMRTLDTIRSQWDLTYPFE